MPRYLKRRPPCVECGEPALITRLEQAPHAMCPPCQLARREVHRVQSAEWMANRSADTGNEALQSKALAQDVAAPWLRSISYQLEAASHSLTAIRCRPSPRQRMHLLKRMEMNVQVALENLAALRPYLERARKDITGDVGLRVVEGEGMQTDGHRATLKLCEGE